MTGTSKTTGLPTYTPEPLETAWEHHLTVWQGCINFAPGDRRLPNVRPGADQGELF